MLSTKNTTWDIKKAHNKVIIGVLTPGFSVHLLAPHYLIKGHAWGCFTNTICPMEPTSCQTRLLPEIAAKPVTTPHPAASPCPHNMAPQNLKYALFFNLGPVSYLLMILHK